MQCARQGFALGLTVLAGTVHNIKVDSFLKLVVNLLEVTSSMKGQVGNGSGMIILFFTFFNMIRTIFVYSCEIAGSKRLSVGALICLWCSGSIRKTHTGVEYGEKHSIH